MPIGAGSAILLQPLNLHFIPTIHTLTWFKENDIVTAQFYLLNVTKTISIFACLQNSLNFVMIPRCRLKREFKISAVGDCHSDDLDSRNSRWRLSAIQFYRKI
jgi:hypothetical protein